MSVLVSHSRAGISCTAPDGTSSARTSLAGAQSCEILQEDRCLQLPALARDFSLNKSKIHTCTWNCDCPHHGTSGILGALLGR